MHQRGNFAQGEAPVAGGKAERLQERPGQVHRAVFAVVEPGAAASADERRVEFVEGRKRMRRARRRARLAQERRHQRADDQRDGAQDDGVEHPGGRALEHVARRRRHQNGLAVVEPAPGEGDGAARKVEPRRGRGVIVERAQGPGRNLHEIGAALGGQDVARRRQVKQRRKAAGLHRRQRFAHRRAGHDRDIERRRAVAGRLRKPELGFGRAQRRLVVHFEDEQRRQHDEECARQHGETARRQRVDARREPICVHFLLLVRHVPSVRGPDQG